MDGWNILQEEKKECIKLLKSHVTPSFQIEGTKKLLNKDLGELISKMRLAQQNAVTSLKEECTRQMLAAAHTLALDSKNLLDAVDQARVRANLAKPRGEEEQEPCDAWLVFWRVNKEVAVYKTLGGFYCFFPHVVLYQWGGCMWAFEGHFQAWVNILEATLKCDLPQ